MGSTWNHPVWGSFEHNGYAWTGSVEIPAFAHFSYNGGNFDEPRPTDTYELNFRTAGADEAPSHEAVELAERVLANQLELVNLIARALWDDFNGEGADSGMWWHGELEEVKNGLDPEMLIEGPDDIVALLEVSSVTIHTDVHDYNGALAEIDFNAAFEEEHGVGVLTNGAAVLGTGYAVSVELFGE